MIQHFEIDRIVDRIVADFKPEKIILFGSCASGNRNSDSDLDLLIVRPTDQPRYRRSFAIRKSLIGTRIPMDIIVYTPQEYEGEKDVHFSFLNNALKHARVLYERTN